MTTDNTHINIKPDAARRQTWISGTLDLSTAAKMFGDLEFAKSYVGCHLVTDFGLSGGRFTMGMIDCKGDPVLMEHMYAILARHRELTEGIPPTFSPFSATPA